MLVAASMAAFYCGIEAVSRRRHLAWMAAFWLLVGLANLAKQFVPLLAAWPVLAYLFWRQSTLSRGDAVALRWLRIFLIATAVGVGVVVAVSFVPALRWWRLAGVGGEAGAYVTIAAAFGLPMLWYLIAARGWRQLLPLLPTALPGIVVAIAMFAWWMVYIVHLFPHLSEEVLAHEVTDRGAGVGGWRADSPVRYLQSLVTYTLPWVALLPGACAVALMRRFERYRSGLVYLLLWCAGFVAIFAAAAGKREHYILPMLPAFSMLMGFVAEDVFFTHAWIRPRSARWIGLGYAPVGLVGVVVAATAYFLSGRQERWLHMGIVAAAVTVPVGLAGLLIWRQRFRAGLAILLASITLVYVGYYNWARLWDNNRPVAQFAAAAARIVPPDAPVYHWNDPQAKTAFYFGRYIPAIQWPLERQDPDLTPTAALKLVESQLRRAPGEAPWMFTYDRDMPALEALGYRVVLESQGRDESGLLFVLCHRGAAEAVASTFPSSASRPDE